MNHSSFDANALDYVKGGGLVTVVAQDAGTGDVLMVAHADRVAIEETLATGEMHYHSRTRGLWRKGAVSGNVQRVVTLTQDCDRDAVLARVIPAGPACHTGRMSCFDEAVVAIDALIMLDRTIAERADDPGGAGYTRRLLGDRNLRLKKIGEESAELVTALADDDVSRAVAEAADVFYHVLVALRSVNAGLSDVRAELATRAQSARAGEGSSSEAECATAPELAANTR